MVFNLNIRRIIHILDHFIVIAAGKHFYSQTQAHLLASYVINNIKKALHPIVGWSPSTFWHHPIDVLAWVLDIAGLAMDTVLCIYLQSHPVSSFHGNILIHTWVGRCIKMEMFFPGKLAWNSS